MRAIGKPLHSQTYINASGQLHIARNHDSLVEFSPGILAFLGTNHKCEPLVSFSKEQLRLRKTHAPDHDLDDCNLDNMERDDDPSITDETLVNEQLRHVNQTHGYTDDGPEIDAADGTAQSNPWKCSYPGAGFLNAVKKVWYSLKYCTKSDLTSKAVGVILKAITKKFEWADQNAEAIKNGEGVTDAKALLRRLCMCMLGSLVISSTEACAYLLGLDDFKSSHDYQPFEPYSLIRRLVEEGHVVADDSFRDARWMTGTACHKHNLTDPAVTLERKCYVETLLCVKDQHLSPWSIMRYFQLCGMRNASLHFTAQHPGHKRVGLKRRENPCIPFNLMKGPPKPESPVFPLYMLTVYTNFGLQCMGSKSKKRLSLPDIASLYRAALNDDSESAKQLRVFHENIVIASVSESAAQKELGERLNEATYSGSGEFSTAEQHAMQEEMEMARREDFLEESCYEEMGQKELQMTLWCEAGREAHKKASANMLGNALRDMSKKVSAMSQRLMEETPDNDTANICEQSNSSAVILPNALGEDYTREGFHAFVEKELDTLKQREKAAYSGNCASTTIVDHGDLANIYRTFMDPVLVREHLANLSDLQRKRKTRDQTTPQSRRDYFQRIGLGAIKWDPAPWIISREDVAELFNLYTDVNKLFALYEFIDYVDEYEHFVYGSRKSPPPKQRLGFTQGGPGTGKTWVLRAMVWYLYQRALLSGAQFSAATAKAAANMSTPVSKGHTLHHAFALSVGNKKDERTKSSKDMAAARINNAFLFFIDEFPMNTTAFVSKINRAVVSDANASYNELFAGKGLRTSGDYLQLTNSGGSTLYRGAADEPDVMDTSTAGIKPKSLSTNVQDSINGRLLWKQFDHVHIFEEKSRYLATDQGRALAHIISELERGSLSVASIDKLNALTLENRMANATTAQEKCRWLNGLHAVRRNNLIEEIALQTMVASGLASGERIYIWVNKDVKTRDSTTFSSKERRFVNSFGFKHKQGVDTIGHRIMAFYKGCRYELCRNKFRNLGWFNHQALIGEQIVLHWDDAHKASSTSPIVYLDHPPLTIKCKMLGENAISGRLNIHSTTRTFTLSRVNPSTKVKSFMTITRSGILECLMAHVLTDYAVQGDTIKDPNKFIVDLRKTIGRTSKGSLLVLLSRIQTLEQLALLAPLWETPAERSIYIRWIQGNATIDKDLKADLHRLRRLSQATKERYPGLYNAAKQDSNRYLQWLKDHPEEDPWAGIVDRSHLQT
jgi:hypothetical protein